MIGEFKTFHVYCYDRNDPRLCERTYVVTAPDDIYATNYASLVANHYPAARPVPYIMRVSAPMKRTLHGGALVHGWYEGSAYHSVNYVPQP